MRNIITLGTFLLLNCLPTFSSAQNLQGTEWAVIPDFHGQDARKELSGAVCAGEDNEKVWCLAVNDEKKTAQFFSIEDRTIRPTERIRFLPDSEDDVEFDEIDAEGAAYDDGFVYVTGSHGLSRSSAKFRPSQFFVFRFPVNETTGKPQFESSSDDVSGSIERSSKLREAIQRTSPIAPFAEQSLNVNGANIEGLAVVDGQMFFGFRGPSLDGQAFLLEISADDIFDDGKPDPVVHPLGLGYGVGIRDLARVNDGLLVLSGHVNEADIAPKIYFWNVDTEKLDPLGELPVVAGKKAETLLVLDERSENGAKKYRVLILYDGLKNGGPVEYTISR